MNKSIIAEGKTSTDAINNGLKELNVSKDKVDIKILESKTKKSFFSILAPRVVQVELTLKENIETKKRREVSSSSRKQFIKSGDTTIEDLDKVKAIVEDLLKVITKNYVCNIDIKVDNITIYVNIDGKDAPKLIGYRGEVLTSIETLLITVAFKSCDSRVKVNLDICNYKSKRAKVLENLAFNVAKSVVEYGKSVTLDPMSTYERKIVHDALQNNEKIESYSIGTDPNRKIIVSLKK